MGKNTGALTGRAWNLLRLALIWARKGGVFKWVLTTRRHLRLLRSSPKSFRAGPKDRIFCGERQFSFDETPTFRFKMHRPNSMRMLHIPCINPPADEEDAQVFFNHHGESFCEIDAVEEEYGISYHEEEGEKGVDAKAEEFIANFYEQMKLQRQASFLQYNEMLQRGCC